MGAIVLISGAPDARLRFGMDSVGIILVILSGVMLDLALDKCGDRQADLGPRIRKMTCITEICLRIVGMYRFHTVRRAFL